MFKQILNYELQKISLDMDSIMRRKKEINEIERRISSLAQEIIDETEKQKMSFFYKIFHRKRYKETLKLTSQTISAKIKEKKELGHIIEQIDESSEKNKLNERLIELKEKYDKMKQAQSLKDLGFNFKSAFEFLIEHNIPVVFEKDERIENKDVESSDGKIKNESDLVLVHKTNYIPQNDTIQTSKSVIKYEEIITLGGKEYKINYPEGRDTIHFSVNHEVNKHAMGSWNNTKYAVIIPFSNVKKETIGSAHPTDTFLKGNVKLDVGTYILCPIGEGKFVREQNPNAQVIEYEGEKVLRLCQYAYWCFRIFS